ncbi:MAG: hypothetical protein BZY75_04885 [SAR202 cluster bacterium Io17-Chloro-G7]|nr:MAG: hypothetical protein BZY75_04885 [SAR202 cluster bacterium Io17-Chloro-G7]
MDNNNNNHGDPGQVSDQKSARRPRRRLGFLHRPFVHLERTLGAGILIILPIGITALVLKFFFDLLNPILEPITDYLPGRQVSGLGLVALVLLLYLVGLVAAFVVGRKLIGVGHRVMEFIPLVKGIYSTTRAAVGMLSNTNDHRYSGVVLIDFPRKGIKSIGLITSRMTDYNGVEMLAIYIPTTPIPSSGFLIIAPVDQVTLTDMSVEEAMRVVISGGVLSGQVFERLGVVLRTNFPSDD